MNKTQMLEALRRGERVRHRNFSSDETMELFGSVIIFEDGCACSVEEFWKFRTDRSWDEDWGIVKKVPPDEQLRIAKSALQSIAATWDRIGPPDVEYHEIADSALREMRGW